MSALSLPQELPWNAIGPLLGVRGAPGPDLLVQAQNAYRELRTAAEPRMVWLRLDIARARQLIRGRDLALHLQGCDACVLMAVTLGSGVDLLLRRAQVRDVAAAVMLDAVASAAAETAADQAEQILHREARSRGRWMTRRFSPGYGDCPLSLQKDLVRLLDAPRQIGLSATENCLLTPRKSVTAFCGEAPHPVTGKLAGCETCALRDTCQKRKEGIPCHGATLEE